MAPNESRKLLSDDMRNSMSPKSLPSVSKSCAALSSSLRSPFSLRSPESLSLLECLAKDMASAAAFVMSMK